MGILLQLVFLLLLGTASFYIYRNVKRIRRNILLGKPENRADQPMLRLKTMALVALGQKKMFKKPIPAILHLDRKSTRLNSSHSTLSRMPSSA